MLLIVYFSCFTYCNISQAHTDSNSKTRPSGVHKHIQICTKNSMANEMNQRTKLHKTNEAKPERKSKSWNVKKSEEEINPPEILSVVLEIRL